MRKARVSGPSSLYGSAFLPKNNDCDVSHDSLLPAALDDVETDGTATPCKSCSQPRCASFFLRGKFASEAVVIFDDLVQGR